MLVQGQVGQPTTTSIAAGTAQSIRQGQLGDIVVSELHGRYYEQAYRNNLFNLSVTTAAAITAYTGAAGGTPQIAVYNPIGSGKNAVILYASFANIVAASAAGTVAWSLYFGPTAAITQTTTSSAVNMGTLQKTGSVMTGFTNVALTSSTALTNNIPIGFYYWATAAGAFNSAPTMVDLGGSLVVPPGTMVALGGSAALTSATWIGSLTWEEVPI
jgi:hypothetical protein